MFTFQILCLFLPWSTLTWNLPAVRILGPSLQQEPRYQADDCLAQADCVRDGVLWLSLRASFFVIGDSSAGSTHPLGTQSGGSLTPVPVGNCPAPCDSLPLPTPSDDLDLSVPSAFCCELDIQCTGILWEGGYGKTRGLWLPWPIMKGYRRTTFWKDIYSNLGSYGRVLLFSVWYFIKAFTMSCRNSKHSIVGLR